MNYPNGRDLLAKLIELLAEQEGVIIRFSIESAKEGAMCEVEQTG